MLRPVYTCNFYCDFLLLMHVNEQMKTNVLNTCTFVSTFITHPLVHIQQKKIAPKIAAKNRKSKRAFSLSTVSGSTQ